MLGVTAIVVAVFWIIGMFLDAWDEAGVELEKRRREKQRRKRP